MKRKRRTRVTSRADFDIEHEDLERNVSDIDLSQRSKEAGKVDHFKPVRSADLAVNPTKLEELRSTFKNCFSKRGRINRCLLLTGPSGCGKTSAVRVLTNELGYECIEYTSEHTCELREGFRDGNNFHEASEEESFISFLQKADYCSLETTIGEAEKPRNKVMIVELLPSAFIRDPPKFREAIEPLLVLSHSMIVFIFSDSDSTYELSYRRFFPSDFIMKNCIIELSFNASATRFLQKALQRAATLKSIKVSTQEIKRIAEDSNGDIRCAVRTFEFSVSSNGEWIPGIQPNTNTQINLFHMLGRIFYAKRTEETEENRRIESRLPIKNLRRPPLERNLDNILHSSGLPDDQVLLFLLEHSPNFSTSMRSLSSILTTLADCDARRAHFWENNDRVLKHTAAYVAGSKVMFENYSQIGESSKKRGPYRFTKSKWTELQRNAATLKKETEMRARMQNMDSAADLFTLRIPLNPANSHSSDNLALKTFGYLGRKMNYSWSLGRDLWMSSQLQNRALTTFDCPIYSQATTESSQPLFNFDIEEDSS